MNNKKRNRKMKHTKGKWEVKQSGGKREVVCGDMTIASGLYDENKSPSIEEVDANANLIVLAPEMIEMLKVCVLQLPDETAEEVSNLIDKAEGETK
jgi:cation diffusion facilitator CzcD-associated flavoprotein CzcO